MSSDSLAMIGADRKQLNLFFGKMLDGFAYHKIVLDKKGKPIDYVFLEVNDAFERLTGLKKEKILGKKVTEVVKGIENDPSDWISVYGRVALAGESIQFENFAESLGKWFDVSAYCPEKGYFVALFEDITGRKKSEEQLQSMASFPEQNPEPVMRVGRDGTVLFTNAAGSAVLHAWKCEVGKVVPEKWLRLVTEALDSGRRSIIEEIYRRRAFSFVIAPFDTHANIYGHEITARKRLEDQLYVSEKRYRTLYETMVEGVVYVDMDGRFVECNRAYTDMLGYSKDELKTLPCDQLIEDKKGIVEKGYSGLMEKRLVRKDGEGIFTNIRVWLNRDENGAPVGMWAIVRDITLGKKAEMALRESEERFRTIARTSPIQISVSRARDGVILFTNAAYDQTFGFAKEELTDFHAPDLYMDPAERIELVKAFEKQGFLRDREIRVKRKDGTPFWVSASLSPIRFGGEQAILGVSIDITERKKAGETLRETRDYLDNLLFYANAPIIVWDPEFKITLFNRAFERLTGLSAKDVIGNKLEILFPEDKKDEALSYIQRALEGERWETLEIPILHSDGTTRIALWNSANVHDTNGKVMATIAQGQDITERKKMEASIEQYAKHLEELVEEKTRQLKDAERLSAIGQTAGMVGHDIRNPLQSILTATYLVKDDLAVLPESEQKKSLLQSVQEIEEQAVYIDKIIVDLQDYARTLRPYLEEINLEPTINSLLSNFKVPQNIEVKTKFDDEAKKLVTDSGCVTRILSNLISNAIQAMPNGGKLTISTTRQMHDVVMMVEDTGTGIPEDIKSRIFEPLFTTKSKGQGFGLAVVKRLAEALGGTITFESQQNKGTIFTLRLPSTNEQLQSYTVNKS